MPVEWPAQSQGGMSVSGTVRAGCATEPPRRGYGVVRTRSVERPSTRWRLQACAELRALTATRWPATVSEPIRRSVMAGIADKVDKAYESKTAEELINAPVGRAPRRERERRRASQGCVRYRHHRRTRHQQVLPLGASHRRACGLTILIGLDPPRPGVDHSSRAAYRATPASLQLDVALRPAARRRSVAPV